MPKAELEPLRPIAANVWTARRGTARTVAFRLADGTLALYSPVAGITDGFRESVAVLGTVSVLIAPNQFHHLGLAEHAEGFAVRTIVAPTDAIPRLVRQTGLDFAPLEAVADRLSASLALHVTQGAKANEAWLSFPHVGGSGWAVCDAFAAKAAPDDPPTNEPIMRGAFAAMCLPKELQQRETYKTWARGRIAAERPTLLLPCHGGAVVAPDLPEGLLALVEAL